MAKKAESATETVETPPAQEVSDAPSEEVVTTEETVTDSPETVASEKEEKLYAGKFKTSEELEKSYEEAQRKITALGQANAQSGGQVPEPGYAPPVGAMGNDLPFDEQTLTGLEQWYSRRREQEKSQEFVRKHAEELKDPLLAGATQRIIAEANAASRYLDQEEALGNAKKLLEERLQPKVDKAKTDSFSEGQEVARKKEQAGAIGTTSQSTPIKGDDELTATEYASKHNIPRA